MVYLQHAHYTKAEGPAACPGCGCCPCRCQGTY